MITYVNTVLVSNLASSNLLSAAPQAAVALNTPSTDAGKFLIITVDEKAAEGDSSFPYITASNADKYNRIKIGIVTKKNAVKVNYATGAATYEPIVKWSNVIASDSIKSYSISEYAADTEDTVTIDFTSLDSSLKTLFAEGGKRIIVRITFKDLPTRFRKWTESYEYVTEAGDTETTIAANIGNMINREWKRARVSANVATSKKIILSALPYSDDDSVDSINWANKCRFNVNIYYTDPAAEGWEATNKKFPKGVTIVKTPGKQYVASAKLVRDRESQALGYQGILNRGEGTWPIVKPAMETQLDGKYDAITLEFERMYRSADDLFRKTKECVEIYGNRGSADSSALSSIAAVLDVFINGPVPEETNGSEDLNG